MVKKSIKQKSKYVCFALKEGVDLTKYVSKLTDDELEIVVLDNPKILKYLTTDHIKHIERSILLDPQSFRYLNYPPDKILIEWIKFNPRIIIAIIENPSDAVLDFICKNYILEALKMHLRAGKRRKIIENAVEQRCFLDRIWGGWSTIERYLSNFDKFYINILTNRGGLYWPDSIEEYIYDYKYISTMSILTDGPDQKFEGGFDFDLEFNYLN